MALKLGIQANHFQKMKDFYIKRAVEARRNGNQADSKIYEGQAATNEKTRILTLKNLQKLEEIEAETRLAKTMQETAKEVREMKKDANREKNRDAILESVLEISGNNEEDQIIPDAINAALQKNDFEPNTTQEMVHKEIEAKLKSELEPGVEVERLREEIKKELQKEEL